MTAGWIAVVLCVLIGLPLLTMWIERRTPQPPPAKFHAPPSAWGMPRLSRTQQRRLLVRSARIRLGMIVYLVGIGSYVLIFPVHATLWDKAIGEVFVICLLALQVWLLRKIVLDIRVIDGAGAED